MTLKCRCKAISEDHLKAAQGTNPLTTEELYATALEIKKADPAARITGLESVNGNGMNCGRCRDDFEVVRSIVPVAMPVIMLHVIGASARPPRIGDCGKDCNTCAPQVVEAAACQPRTL